MIVDYRSDPFSDRSKHVAMATILGLKWVKSSDLPSFVDLAFVNGVEYRNDDFKGFICDDLATLCKNLITSMQ